VEYLHTSCVKIAEENGKEVYFYKVYRGTHTYDTKEMAKLIDGTIHECKNVGIETATPKQIEEMQRLWEQHYLNKKEENK
jgi:low affinity Fe/Cu permease